MITVKKNSLKRWLGSSLFLFAGALITVVFALAWRTYVGPYEAPEANGAPPLQAPPVTSGDLYMIVQGWDGLDSVLVLNPNSGKVNRRFEAGYNAAVKLTADKRTLYIYSQAHSEDETSKGATSAIDTGTGKMLWQVNIPATPFTGSPVTGVWLSADEKRLYLQGSPNNSVPHVFVVDTQTGILLHDFELPLPYPSNASQAFPRVWKLPWAEALVVASRDQLFTFDLASGKISDSIRLLTPESIERVPKNLPRATFVWDGALDPDTRQLFLATSTQEIISVNLNTQPFTFKPVANLPAGWQFAVMHSFLLHAKEKAIYVQVKRADTPIVNGLEVEEVWVYDTTTWTRKSSLSLRELIANSPTNPAQSDSSSDLDLTNLGLALSHDGQNVYSLTRQGLWRLNQALSGKLNEAWLNVGEKDQAIALIFVVP